MKNLLGIKNINRHSEQSEESLTTTFCKGSFGNFPQDDRGKCITPPEFLSSQSSLRNSTLPVQGGRKFAKAGFTLAEVLITLGIIGVVAAMTIPALITKYQKQVAATQLKKHYSQLNQVLMRISEDPGLDVLDSNATTFVPKYIQPHYAGSTYFAPTSNHKKIMCWNPENYYLGAKANDAQYASVNNKGLSSGYIQTPFLPGQTASIMLQDGSCIGFNNKIVNAVDKATIFVDINGSHVPPNRLGRDLFWFHVDQEKFTVVPTDASGKYGIFDFPNLKIGVERIKNAGWTIPKDYPWK